MVVANLCTEVLPLPYHVSILGYHDDHGMASVALFGLHLLDNPDKILPDAIHL